MRRTFKANGEGKPETTFWFESKASPNSGNGFVAWAGWGLKLPTGDMNKAGQYFRSQEEADSWMHRTMEELLGKGRSQGAKIEEVL